MTAQRQRRHASPTRSCGAWRRARSARPGRARRRDRRARRAGRPSFGAAAAADARRRRGAVRAPASTRPGDLLRLRPAAPRRRRPARPAATTSGARLLESLELAARVADPAAGVRRRRGRCSTAAREQGLEGVVAKRRDVAVPARPARRATWIKIKHLRTQEVVVGGWTPGKGRRAGSIGSLLLGVPGRRRAALRRPRRHRLHRRDARRPRARCAEPLAATVAVRARCRARGARTRWVDPSRRRGRVHRVDPGRPAAPSGLARPAARQAPRRRRPGAHARCPAPRSSAPAASYAGR